MASDEKSDENQTERDLMSREESPTEAGIRRLVDGFELYTPRLGDAGCALPDMSALRPVFMVNHPIFQYRCPRTNDGNIVDQALMEIPPPEDLSHHFSDADLERTIEEKYLSFTANACNDHTNYRRLVRKLKLDQSSLWRLDREYGSHVREYIYRVLLTWKRRHPEAKVRDLVKLLSESKRPDSALMLKKLFSSIDWRD